MVGVFDHCYKNTGLPNTRKLAHQAGFAALPIGLVVTGHSWRRIMYMPIGRLMCLPTLVCLALWGQAQAAPEEKPFAEKKIVLQISDDDVASQTLVLNVASNLVRHYGPDQVDVEIVAFGPGLRLLFADNSNSGRIDSLVESSGVRFSACMNTLKKMTKTLGREPVLDANARPVPAGVVRILDLVGEGYVLIRP
jgi:intracellular sulfur oxidation DsrE/DsrF family protein